MTAARVACRCAGHRSHPLHPPHPRHPTPRHPTPPQSPHPTAGLPTGGSPLPTYRKLVEYHRAGELSFEHVVTFNMDEYVGLPRAHPQSYHHFMWDNFFRHINIKPENAHILDGNAANLQEECDRYEAKIAAFGGIELFLAGIGEDGHIAFSAWHARARARPCGFPPQPPARDTTTPRTRRRAGVQLGVAHARQDAGVRHHPGQLAVL